MAIGTVLLLGALMELLREGPAYLYDVCRNKDFEEVSERQQRDAKVKLSNKEYGE